MTLRFGNPSPRRRPSLTPMIDVVFLLLVFFMLAARFGQEAEVALSPAGTAAGLAWTGPPRLLDIGAEDLRLNGRPLPEPEVIAGLRALMADDADPVLLRPTEGTSVQRLLDVMALLSGAGLSGAVVVGP